MNANELFTMLQQQGIRGGTVYATGILKAGEVSRMAAAFRAQEYKKNEKAAGQGDFIVIASLRKNLETSIPVAYEIGKEGSIHA
ncbi:hypothetical protein [Paenibacillus sp. KR2-11]|uniref:hypothetical protein n=1 Tax=Paenibacillus sp. KR2-11 TaxID=3385500 RepID=UPI0038FCBEF0